MSAGNPVGCKKCKTIIQSTYRHDFVRCPCGAIFIDGGSEYTRWGGQDPAQVEWSLEKLILEDYKWSKK